jgi:hypothetical protein
MMKLRTVKGARESAEKEEVEDAEGEHEEESASGKRAGPFSAVVGAVAQVGLMSIVVGVLFYMLGYSSAECPRA